MSTRATYSFTTDYGTTYIYIHHDGYPDGAAMYLHNAFSGKGSISAESFIRGNDRAEITRSHDQHSDTEYRYSIKGDQLIAERGYGDDWQTFFVGFWWDFVADNTGYIDDFQKIKLCTINEYGHETPMTKAVLESTNDDNMRLLGRWFTNGHSKSANFKGLETRINLITVGLRDF